MKDIFLSDAKIGKVYIIKGMCENIDIKIKTRLFELGFFQGEKVSILSRSMGKGVLLVQIQNMVLSIRKFEANCVVIYE